jgi:hypothetical protein
LDAVPQQQPRHTVTVQPAVPPGSLRPAMEPPHHANIC